MYYFVLFHLINKEVVGLGSLELTPLEAKQMRIQRGRLGFVLDAAAYTF